MVKNRKHQNPKPAQNFVMLGIWATAEACCESACGGCVNVLFHINKLMAQIMREFEEYEPGILEIHHTAKLDKPSGTAITLAEGILENIPKKTKWVNDLAQQPEELTIISQREGEVPGTHVINYTSAVDNLSLVHQANNRQGFALGAVKAAEFIVGKKGVFTMNDMLKFSA